MSEHPAEKDAHAIRYSDGTTDVFLTVPWGWHSGNIPPPFIAFGDRKFLYAGSLDTTVIPPGEQS